MASPFILKKSAAGEHRESVPAVGPFVDLLGFLLMAELLARGWGRVLARMGRGGRQSLEPGYQAGGGKTQ
jgi:hypothetical protein